MNNNSTTLVYFSPTGTTRRIVETIARRLQTAEVQHLDLTPPAAREQIFPELEGGLAIIGMPVYGGRLPAEAAARFRRLRGRNIPAVVVVVYGNRAYEDALLELRDLALEAGFRPLAGAAFVAEHSFSSDLLPIAPGRPDAADLVRALDFGRAVQAKLEALASPVEVPPLAVPGDSPYRGIRLPENVSPAADEALCTLCGTCLGVCPVEAISLQETVVTDAGLCILCYACIRACPGGGRRMEDPGMQQTTEWLSANCRERREPEIFI